MPRILLVTYYFPPQSNGGVARPFSLYTHLPSDGWEVYVLTTDSSGSLPQEPRVHRCPALWNWKKKPNRLLKLLYRGARNLLSRVGWPELPDLLWQKQAATAGARLAESIAFDLIYATYPSSEALRVGLVLHERLSIPLIMEFRDGLVYDPLWRQVLAYEKRIRRFERRCVESAACVITIGERLSEYFRRAYGRAHVLTITNGYEESDFSALPARRPPEPGKLRLFTFGSLSASRSRDASPLFAALSALAASGRIDADRLQVHLVGRHSRTERDLVRRFGVEHLVSFHEPMPKREGLEWLAREATHLLLYGVPGASTVVSSKIFEYLRLGLPIIGVCEGNEAADIIRRTGSGEVCGFSKEEIEGLLVTALEGRIRFAPDESAIKGFDRRLQAHKIAGILHSVTRP